MILFLDDETSITDIYSKLMRKKYGFEVEVYNSPTAALKAVKKSPGLYDVIISDFKMPEMNGLIFSQKIRESNQTAKIMICTGDPNLISDDAAFDAKLFSVLKKPLLTEEIAKQIQAARSEN